jgi:cell division protein FtsX
LAQTFNFHVHNLRFWLAETVSNFARDGVRSVWSLLLIAAMLGILGASGWFVSNFHRALAAQTARLELVVLVDKRISPARRREIFRRRAFLRSKNSNSLSLRRRSNVTARI